MAEKFVVGFIVICSLIVIATLTVALMTFMINVALDAIIEIVLKIKGMLR